MSWQNKVYGLPKFSSVQTMFWNKSLLTKASLDPEAAPENWDDFVTAAKALTTGEQFGYACDIGNPAGAYQNFLRALLLNGGEMYDEDYKPVFNSEQVSRPCRSSSTCSRSTRSWIRPRCRPRTHPI